MAPQMMLWKQLTLRIRLDGSAVLSVQTLVIDPGQVAPVTAAGFSKCGFQGV